MARFCPHCGKSDSDAKFHGEVCEDCAKARLKPLAHVRISACQKCGSVTDKARKRKEWGIPDEISRILKLKRANPSYSEGCASVEYDTPLGRVSQKLDVIVGKSVCLECGRASTQYFEAIIQLRGDERKVARMAERVGKKVREKSFIPKIEELKEGPDIYCGDRKAAIAALNAFSLPFVRTEKLAGERDGKRLYRTTLLVRL